MRTCPACGQQVDDSLDFCTVCGAYFSASRSGTVIEDPKNPVELAISRLDRGMYCEGVTAWRSAVACDQQDDVTYRKMVDSIAGCMLSIVVDNECYRSREIIELARSMRGRDLLPDVMAKLVENLNICVIQNGVLGLSSSYNMLFLECFSVYTDMGVLSGICKRACDDISLMISKATDLPDAIHAKGPSPIDWLESYLDFAYKVKCTVDGIVSDVDPEVLDRIADSWAGRDIVYVKFLNVAFLMNNKATSAGRFRSRVYMNTRDLQLAAMSKKYLLGGPEEQ